MISITRCDLQVIAEPCSLDEVPSTQEVTFWNTFLDRDCRSSNPERKEKNLLGVGEACQTASILCSSIQLLIEYHKQLLHFSAR